MQHIDAEHWEGTEYWRLKMQSTKPVGRPKGTFADDRKELDAIADVLLINPLMTERSAMLQVLDRSPNRRASAADRGLRTLQRKWRAQKIERMQAAKDRQAEKRKEMWTLPQNALNIDPETREHMLRNMAAASDALSSLSKRLRTSPEMQTALTNIQKFSEGLNTVLSSPEMKSKLDCIVSVHNGMNATLRSPEVQKKLLNMSLAFSDLERRSYRL